jgi:cytochrome c oxidase cbb3-type subunit 3
MKRPCPKWFFVLWLAWPLTGIAAEDGARLYERHCAACHGLDGKGGVGVPLALPAFQSSVSDHYLEATIRSGRPGRVMPAFSGLSDEDVEAIVRVIRSWHEGPVPIDSAARIAGDPEHGGVLFAEHCANCHGANGQGGHGTGKTFSRPRDFPIMPPALNNPGFLAAASDAMIRETLIQGREGTPMPSFLKQGLTEEDIEDIVSFVRAFESSLPPVSKADTEADRAVLIAESPYDLKETVENVRRAIIGKNFRLIREQYLEDGLMPAGKENQNQVIVYFCNFKFLYDALALDPRVGMFLPCRVTVVEQEGQVKVMSANPRRVSRLFNNSELDNVCDEMYRLYTEILEEATL